MPESRAQHKPGEVCPRCGFVHKTKTGGDACVGHRLNGKACAKAPNHDQSVCRVHGGSAPQNKLAADRRQAEAEVEKAVNALVAAEDRTPDPVADMHRAMVRAHVLAEFLETKIREIDEWRYTDFKGSEQLNSYVALYERALDRVQKFSIEYVRLGFEAKMVKLEEDKVALVVAAFQAAVIAASLPTTQATALRSAFAKQLRESE